MERSGRVVLENTTEYQAKIPITSG